MEQETETTYDKPEFINLNDISTGHIEVKKFQCQKCVESFDKDSHLELHQMLHSEDPWCKLCNKAIKRNKVKTHIEFHIDTQCHICNKTFQNRKTLQPHLKRHVSLFACSHCDKSFNSKASLRVHEISHSGGFKCDICEQTFSTKSALNRHSRNMHKSGTFECCYCDEKFEEKQLLRNHLSQHYTRSSAYKCIECCISFNSKKLFKKHSHQDHPDVNWMAMLEKNMHFMCLICNDHFPNEAGIRKHVKNHYSKERCEYCSRLMHKSDIAKHIEKIHYERKCEKCGLIFYTSAKYDCHVFSHGVICEKCPMQFKNKLVLLRHISQCHKQVEPQVLTCKICRIGFKTESAFQTHLRKHSDKSFRFNSVMNRLQKVYECLQCNAIYLTNKLFKKHLLNHDNISFNCKICGLSFNSQKLLRMHFFDHKSKEYKCNICSREFYYEINLINHKKTHLKRMVFKCTLCSQQFKCKSRLNRHERVQHNLVIEKKIAKNAVECRICGIILGNKRITILRHFNKYHPGEGIHLCKICNKSFNLSKNFRIHECKAYEKCKCCDELVLKEKMETHVKTHQNCIFCPSNYKCVESLITHVVNTHIVDKNFICKDCNLNFNDAFTSYQAHKKDLHNEIINCFDFVDENNIQYYCKICNVYYLKKCNCTFELKQNAVEVKQTKQDENITQIIQNEDFIKQEVMDCNEDQND